MVEAVDDKTSAVSTSLGHSSDKLGQRATGVRVVEGRVQVGPGELQAREVREHREGLIVGCYACVGQMSCDDGRNSHGEVTHAVEHDTWDSKLGCGFGGPAVEAVGDQEADVGNARKGPLEVRLEKRGCGDEGEEEGDGREVVGALDSCREVGDVVGERELDYVGFEVGEGAAEKGGVERGGEEGEGGEAAAVEEAGKVEEWDGVAFGEEWEDCNMR